MKNLSVALMLLTTLSINLAPAQAVNKQGEMSVNNASHSQGNNITNSNNQYRLYCYLIDLEFLCI